MVTGAYELLKALKEHKPQFHYNPNCVTTFETSKNVASVWALYNQNITCTCISSHVQSIHQIWNTLSNASTVAITTSHERNLIATLVIMVVNSDS